MAGGAVLTPRVALAAGLLSGVLYALSFPGNAAWSDHWAVAFVAFVPLWIALQGQTPKRALLIGLLAGLGMNLVGFYWLLGMLKVFSGFPTAVCALFVVILCAYQGGRTALTGWIYARAAARGWPAATVFAGAFVAGELAYPLLFPWYFGASMHNATSLLQVAELGGPIFVGLMLVGVNIAIAEPLLARLAERPLVRTRMITGALGLLAALVFGMVRIRGVESQMSEAEPLHVGVVQGNLGLMQKRTDPREGLRRHKVLTQELVAKGIDLVVWSESSVTFTVPEPSTDSFFKREVARDLGVSAIFGAVLYRTGPDRDRFFNTALATTSTGEVTSRYDKHFLLAFGEYLPFGETFPKLYEWSPHSGKFTPGTELSPLVVRTRNGREHKVTPLICYEDILPGFTNSAVRQTPDTELLVNITNDAWFGDTTEPWEHLALAKLRSVEHRRYLVRSTNSGVSAVVDPVGRSVVETKTFTQTSAEAEIRWMRPARTIYEWVGDAPFWVFGLATFGLGFVRRRDKLPEETKSR